MFIVPCLKDFMTLPVKNSDGLWINFKDVFAFLKKHHLKSDNLKDIKKYNLIKEFKRHGMDNYQEAEEEIFIGVASLLRYFFNHYDHLEICREVVHQILDQIISAPVNSDEEDNDKSLKAESMEIRVNTEWLSDGDDVPRSGLKLYISNEVDVKEEPEEIQEFQTHSRSSTEMEDNFEYSSVKLQNSENSNPASSTPEIEDEDEENSNRSDNSMKNSSSSNNTDELTPYETHLKFHTNKNSFECDYCEADFKSNISKTLDKKDNLSQVVTSVKTKAVVCKKKDAKNGVKSKTLTKRRSGFKAESELEKKYACPHCDKKFKRKGSLRGHLMTHEEKKTFSCPTCNKVYPRKSLLSYHERTHSGIRPYVCKICGANFTLKSRLSRHLKGHSGEKPYSCNICQASFVQSYDLTRHARIHSGEKPFVCEFCSAAFTQSSNLTLHLRTHTKEKPYECHICDARFAHSSFLTRHLRIHSGVKPYKCQICSVAFTQSSNLTCHLRTHSGEKPYQCEICLSRFTQSSNLKSHMKVHTRAILRPSQIQTSDFEIRANNPPTSSFDSSLNSGQQSSLVMSVDSVI